MSWGDPSPHRNRRWFKDITRWLPGQPQNRQHSRSQCEAKKTNNSVRHFSSACKALSTFLPQQRLIKNNKYTQYCIFLKDDEKKVLTYQRELVSDHNTQYHQVHTFFHVTRVMMRQYSELQRRWSKTTRWQRSKRLEPRRTLLDAWTKPSEQIPGSMRPQ